MFQILHSLLVSGWQAKLRRRQVITLLVRVSHGVLVQIIQAATIRDTTFALALGSS